MTGAQRSTREVEIQARQHHRCTDWNWMSARVRVRLPRATGSEHHPPTPTPPFPGKDAGCTREGLGFVTHPPQLLLLMPHHLFFPRLHPSALPPPAPSTFIRASLVLGYPPRSLPKGPPCLIVLALFRPGFFADCPWGKGEGSLANTGRSQVEAAGEGKEERLFNLH